MSAASPARSVDISRSWSSAMPCDFIIAPMVDVYRFACVSVRPKALPADFAQESILTAPAPKVTSTTFWTSARSEAAEIAALPQLTRMVATPAALRAPTILPTAPVQEFSASSADSAAALSHFLDSLSMFFVTSFRVVFIPFGSPWISNTTLPSAILPSLYHPEERGEHLPHVLAVFLFLLLV